MASKHIKPFSRIKSFSDNELIQKYKALYYYIRDVKEEINLRYQKSGNNTFHQYIRDIEEEIDLCYPKISNNTFILYEET